MRGTGAFVALAAALIVAIPASAEAPAGRFVQDGEKLTSGTKSAFGSSVALSSDGTTALVGAPAGNRDGLAWVFEWDGSGWALPGTKLTRTGTAGRYGGSFGLSVALSADGSTALVGDPDDRSQFGAVWVFARSASGWQRQGGKLTPRDEVGTGDGRGARFGFSVALSADGNTALLGGYWDDASRGAAWVFVRSGPVWKQQGPKLRIRDETPGGELGIGVAVSADGSTALVGRRGDDHSRGGAVVFTRSGTRWRRSGALTPPPSPNSGNGLIGSSVALSADGGTALVGEPGAGFDGAVWVFTRSGSAWTGTGTRLTHGGKRLYAAFGGDVALSADGALALIGGPNANRYVGAAWVFARSGVAWRQQGRPLTGNGERAELDGHFGGSVALSADGQTALIGGRGLGAVAAPGAVWVFRRR